jgi:hypothetical protein
VQLFELHLFQYDLNKNYVNGRIPIINLNVGRSSGTKSEQLSFDIPKTSTTTQKSKQLKEIIRFFKNDLEGILKSVDKTRDEIANELGVHKSYFSNCIHHANDFTRVTPTMKLIYDYFKELQGKMNNGKEETLEQLWGESKKMVEKTNELNNQIEQECIKLGLTEEENQEPVIHHGNVEATVDTKADDTIITTTDNTIWDNKLSYDPDFYNDRYDKEVKLPEIKLPAEYIPAKNYPGLFDAVRECDESEKVDTTLPEDKMSEREHIKTVIFKQINRVYDCDICEVDMEVRRSELLSKLANAYKELD